MIATAPIPLLEAYAAHRLEEAGRGAFARYRKKLEEVMNQTGVVSTTTFQAATEVMDEARTEIGASMGRALATHGNAVDNMFTFQMRNAVLHDMDSITDTLERGLNRGFERGTDAVWELGDGIQVDALRNAGIDIAAPSLSITQLQVMHVTHADLMKGVTEDFAKQTSRIINNGVIGQFTPHQVQGQIQALLRTSPSRSAAKGLRRFGPIATQAERIYRTELHTTFNVANQVRSQDIVNAVPGTRKYWDAIVDHRTRASHIAAEARTAPEPGGEKGGQGGTLAFSRLFKVGASTARFPHDPRLPAKERINCRCTMGLWNKEWFAAEEEQRIQREAEQADEAKVKAAADAAKAEAEAAQAAASEGIRDITPGYHPATRRAAHELIEADLPGPATSFDTQGLVKDGLERKLVERMANNRVAVDQWLDSAGYQRVNNFKEIHQPIKTRRQGFAQRGYANETDDVIDKLFDSKFLQTPGTDATLAEAGDMGAELYKDVKAVVDRWARSSGDNYESSLYSQVAAQEEFAFIRPSANSFVRAAERTKDAVAAAEYRGEIEFRRHVLREMYDETQEQLKAAGFDTITLHRGMYLDDLGGAVVHQSDVTGIKLAELQLQPINSFTTNLDTAGNFGDLIFTADIPIERVIGFTRSGLGCLGEYEFVVADGPGQYIFTQRGFVPFGTEDIVPAVVS